MPLKAKKVTRAKKAKKVKKAAARVTSKAKRRTKKPTVKKTVKKAVAKKSSATKRTTKHKQGKRTPAKTSVKTATNKRTGKTPAEKTAWKISPEISQAVLKIDTWKKGDLKIEHLNVYRSGWITVENLPDLGGYNPDEGINIFEEFEIDEHQLYDGSKEASIFPNELLAEERDRLLGLSEAELEDEGWTLESVTRFKGPLVVEKV
jgi:hypothetical protein